MASQAGGWVSEGNAFIAQKKPAGLLRGRTAAAEAVEREAKMAAMVPMVTCILELVMR